MSVTLCPICDEPWTGHNASATFVHGAEASLTPADIRAARTEGQQVTDDRETAAEIVRDWDLNDEFGYKNLEDRIAAALAAEREKARAPFLALVDEIHERGTAEVGRMEAEPDEYRKNQHASRAATYARAEHLIRKAAER